MKETRAIARAAVVVIVIGIAIAIAIATVIVIVIMIIRAIVIIRAIAIIIEFTLAERMVMIVTIARRPSLETSGRCLRTYPAPAMRCHLACSSCSWAYLHLSRNLK